MTLHARPRVLRRALSAIWLAVTMVLFVAFVLPFNSGATVAAQKGIAFELNTARTVDGACFGTFVLQNGFGRTLDRFQLDLFVYGGGDVIQLRSNIDLAPLRHGKKTVISFRILAGPCKTVSRVLVNDIPLCRAEGGEKLDCLAGLSVSSRNRIELVK
jgi:hypothetical protein